MSDLGTKISELRKSRHVTQGDLARQISIHPSNLSTIENNKQRPRPDLIKRMIDELKLTKKEAEDLISLGNYSVSLLKETSLDYSHYPRTGLQAIYPRLLGEYGRYPGWFIGTDTRVEIFNLLVAWVWKALDLKACKLYPEKLFNRSVFSIYAEEGNFSRIAPPYSASDMLFIKGPVHRKMEEGLPPEAKAFKDRYMSNPVLKLIYEYGTIEPGNEWRYDVRIASPDDPQVWLTFRVTVERVMNAHNEHIGFLIVGQPVGALTITTIERVYNQLIDKFGEEAFVQLQNQSQEEESRELSYPTIYPMLTHDQLFTITSENRAFQLLIEESVVGTFLLDLFVQDKVRELLGSLADSTVLSTMQAFFFLTKPFQDPHHPNHAAYHKIRQQLVTNPAYDRYLDLFWARIRPSDFDGDTHDGAVYNTSLFHCRYATHVFLSFESIAHFPNSPIGEYIHILRPTNTESCTSLLLFLLEDEAMPDEIGTTRYAQLLWFFTILATVNEGIIHERIYDTAWLPEAAYKIALERTHHLASSDFAPTLSIEKWASHQIYLMLFDLYNHSKTASKQAILDIVIGFTQHTNAHYVYELLTLSALATPDSRPAPHTNGQLLIPTPYQHEARIHNSPDETD